jgi:ribosomal protein L27
VNKFVKDARRHSGKLGTPLRKDLEAMQKQLATTGSAASRQRGTARHPTGAKRSGAGRRPSSPS